MSSNDSTRGGNKGAAEAKAIPDATTSFQSIIDEDLRAADKHDHIPWLAEAVVIDQLARPELTNLADVPYGGATASLGRDIATRIAEIEQRLAEVAADIEASKKFADDAVAQADLLALKMIEQIREAREAQADMISANSAQEVAILRGRETDLIKALGHLQGVQKALLNT